MDGRSLRSADGGSSAEPLALHMALRCGPNRDLLQPRPRPAWPGVRVHASDGFLREALGPRGVPAERSRRPRAGAARRGTL